MNLATASSSRFRLETALLLCFAGCAAALLPASGGPTTALLVGALLLQLLRVLALRGEPTRAAPHSLSRMQRLLGVVAAPPRPPLAVVAVTPAAALSPPVAAAPSSPVAPPLPPRTPIAGVVAPSRARAVAASTAVSSLALAPPSAATMRLIVEALVEAKEGVQASRVGPNVNFSSIGLSSMDNMRFSAELSNRFGEYSFLCFVHHMTEYSTNLMMFLCYYFVKVLRSTPRSFTAVPHPRSSRGGSTTNYAEGAPP